MTTPRRRIVLELRIGADSVDDLASALASMAHQVAAEWTEAGLPANGCCGGGGYGWTYTTSVDPSMTPERYARDLDSYLAARRAKKEETP